MSFLFSQYTAKHIYSILRSYSKNIVYCQFNVKYLKINLFPDNMRRKKEILDSKAGKIRACSCKQLICVNSYRVKIQHGASLIIMRRLSELIDLSRPPRSLGGRGRVYLYPQFSCSLRETFVYSCVSSV